MLLSLKRICNGSCTLSLLCQIYFKQCCAVNETLSLNCVCFSEVEASLLFESAARAWLFFKTQGRYASKLFCVLAPLWWDELPLTVWRAHSLAVFKQILNPTSSLKKKTSLKASTKPERKTNLCMPGFSLMVLWPWFVLLRVYILCTLTMDNGIYQILQIMHLITILLTKNERFSIFQLFKLLCNSILFEKTVINPCFHLLHFAVCSPPCLMETFLLFWKTIYRPYKVCLLKRISDEA